MVDDKDNDDERLQRRRAQQLEGARSIPPTRAPIYNVSHLIRPNTEDDQIPGGPVSRAEFLEWHRPSDALKAVPSDIEEKNKRKWIVDRLRYGRLRAASLSSAPGAGEVLQHIASYLWNSEWDQDQFWSVGDVEFRDMQADRYSQLYERQRAWFGEVRIDPAGFPEESGELENVSDKDVAAFCKLYLEFWGDRATQGRALSAAREWFFDKSVPRDPFFAVYNQHGSPRRGQPKKS